MNGSGAESAMGSLERNFHRIFCTGLHVMKAISSATKNCLGKNKLQARQGANLQYVLVTPARNEAEFIELTIKSVANQTMLPLRWVIVSDGSTDATDEIVLGYARVHRWIEFVRIPEHGERNFAAKAKAFNAGYERVKALDFDIIGNLDADVSVEPDYFSFLVSKFELYPDLGVAGTPFREGDFQYDYRFTSPDHVSGACQLFRRECFEAVGGYLPLEAGVDLVAVTMARMRGWKTHAFSEKSYLHQRKTQSNLQAGLRKVFRSGYHDYLLGSDLLWHICKAFYHAAKAPYLAGGAALLAGYLWAFASGAPRRVPAEFVAFRRAEQMRRLKELLLKPFVSRG